MEFIFGIILIAVAIIIGVWIIQWAAACVVWLYQVMLMPFFVYFLPSIILTTIVVGTYIGSYISASNYFLSIKKNVNPEGDLKKVLKYYIISIIMFILIILFIVFAIFSGILIYDLLYKFIHYIIDYYNSIKFPAFNINFPFWK